MWSFADVIGQYALKKHVCELVQQNHLPHAALFYGPEGSGGLPFCLALSRYIFCVNRGPEDACGECNSCVKMNNLQHPDLHFSFPTVRRDGAARPPLSTDFIAEFREFVKQVPYGNDKDWLHFLDSDKQGNITAEECRQIILKLQMRSFESRYKILIMWYPDYLDKEGNILLKLIEEPTAGTLIFFVSHNPDAILPTILSRTQLFPLKRLSDTEIRDALVTQGIDSGKALSVARMSEGNFMQARNLLQDHPHESLPLLRSWLNVLYGNRGLDLVAWLTDIATLNRESQKYFLLYVLQLLEHILRLRLLGKEHVMLPDDELRILEVWISKGMNEKGVYIWQGWLNDAVYALERNAHAKMLFHALSLRIQHWLKESQVAQKVT